MSDPRGKVLESVDSKTLELTLLPGSDDPFTETHKRHLSGYSHGMASPLYDSSTGHGIDRIQSKDIVALMDHLTVRDAQRNARDTEILVTLVRSAAEMRNSFENMKKFIAQQDEMMIDANVKQHDRTQKVVGGPRPQPLGIARTPRHTTADEDVERSKRKGVFKRALKGLSLKGSNDLTRVEDMLVHLLLEVEALRASQEGRSLGTGVANSKENFHEPGQDGYEPEGQTGTSSTGGGDKSGFSNSPRLAGDMKAASNRRGSDHRISPVMEGDEGLEPLTADEQDLLDQQAATDAQLMGHPKRGGSAPLGTPPRVPLASGALSTDTTPKMSNDKSRKHKSSSSSFFPKISRWSKTTASSMGENIRNSIQTSRKDRYSSEISRSGSDLEQDGYNTNDYYDPHGDDRLRSNISLDQRQENRPPSPLVPSQLSEYPKYQAHRDSLNLQHPQPRQGPTDRYQSQLESQAQTFIPPVVLNSDGWASNASLGRMTPNRKASGSDGGYSDKSSTSGRRNAPQRPPKIKDEGPLVPQRPPQGKRDGQLTYAERMASRGSRHSNYDPANGSPIRSSPKNNAPQRKPTGPRPISSSGYPKRH
ncbi:predicted protein [Histoplasma mississippiense (nom. inval.)]|nr:predicted protein [Histoplasma mississippiense (nom. inval.)]EDN10585.1 predicted protein [Histoplasma mississippiense (nom. inval.)]